jgi:DNA-binding CsgD family transcriptional regulator
MSVPEGKWFEYRGSASLTPRQYEIAVWVGRGFSNGKISIQLGIPVRQVAALVKGAMQVKSCSSRLELEELFEPDWAQIDAAEVGVWVSQSSIGPPRKPGRKALKEADTK